MPRGRDAPKRASPVHGRQKFDMQGGMETRFANTVLPAVGSRVTTRNAFSAEDLRDPDFWRAKFPQLDLSSEVDADRHAAEMPYSAEDRALDSQRMLEDGYVQGSHPALETLGPRLAEAARHCVSLGLPPVFLFLFNDVWRCFYALAPAISPFLGSPLCALPDFWLWHIDPKSGDAGWTPHVDKGPRSLTPDGRPRSVTVWIPLSKATPLNSCIYVLPASRDPEYRSPQRRGASTLARFGHCPLAPASGCAGTRRSSTGAARAAALPTSLGSAWPWSFRQAQSRPSTNR